MERTNPIMDMEMGSMSPHPKAISPTSSAASSRPPSPNPGPKIGRRQTYSTVMAHDDDSHSILSVTTTTNNRGEENGMLSFMRGTSSHKLHPWLRWSLSILPIATLLAIPLAVFATISYEATLPGSSSIRVLGIFVWLEFVWLALWLCHLFAHGVPMLFRLFFGVSSAKNRVYHQTLSQIPFAIALVAWMVLAETTLIPFVTMFTTSSNDEDHPSWLIVMSNIGMALIIVALLFLAERFLINLVSVNYKSRQFEARGHINRAHVRILKSLYARAISIYPPFLQSTRERFSALDYTLATGKAVEKPPCPTFLDDLRRAGEQVQDTVGKWASDTILGTALSSSGTVATKLAAASGSVATTKTTRFAVGNNRPSAVLRRVLESKEHVARALGKRLFYSFCKINEEGNVVDALTLADLKEKLDGQVSEIDAQRAFSAIDVDKNGDLTMDELIHFCVAVARERRALDEGATGIDSAVETLDRFLQLLVAVAGLLIVGAFFSASFSMYVAMLGAQIVALSFAVSRTVFDILSACIFIFIKHPYDSGDRVDIDGTRLIVEKMSLLYTVFRRIDSGKRVQISNTALSDRWIENISRSGSMSEVVVIEVDNETPLADMNTMQELLAERLRSPDNKRDFHDDLTMELLELDGLGKFQLRLTVTHKSNWADERLRQRRRNKLLVALIASIRQVPIYGAAGWRPPLGTQFRPSYQVVISKDQALEQQNELKEFLANKRHKEVVEDDVEFITNLATTAPTTMVQDYPGSVPTGLRQKT